MFSDNLSRESNSDCRGAALRTVQNGRDPLNFSLIGYLRCLKKILYQILYIDPLLKNRILGTVFDANVQSNSFWLSRLSKSLMLLFIFIDVILIQCRQHKRKKDLKNEFSKI